MAITTLVQVKNPNENKKRRVSKKSKVAWRKHCDVKDVDDFLEDKALEQRLGGPVTEKPNEELFQIDKQPSVADHLVNLFSSKAAKRASLRKKPIKSFAVLKSHSAVKDPIPKRNRVRTIEERHPIARKIKAYRKEHGILNKKEQLAVKNRTLAYAQKKLAAAEKRKPVHADLWNESQSGIPTDVDQDWLYKSTLVHNLNNTRSRKCAIPRSIHKKLSSTPVIEAPHPGTSYNPSYGDHQTLLQEVVESEMKVIKEEKHLKRVTTGMFSKVTSDQRDKNWMAEMLQGLPQEQNKTEDNVQSESEGEYKAINPPVKNSKKTLQKRRKIKEAKAQAIVRREEKVEKKKISDIHRLTVVEKELKKQVEKQEMLHKKREKVKAIKEKETRHLSHSKFKPQDLDFNLADELTGNLRTIETAGSLITDRYKSLQKRNIVAPTRGIQLRKKSKVKAFEKSNHKMGWEPKGY